MARFENNRVQNMCGFDIIIWTWPATPHPVGIANFSDRITGEVRAITAGIWIYTNPCTPALTPGRSYVALYTGGAIVLSPLPRAMSERDGEPEYVFDENAAAATFRVSQDDDLRTVTIGLLEHASNTVLDAGDTPKAPE